MPIALLAPAELAKSLLLQVLLYAAILMPTWQRVQQLLTRYTGTAPASPLVVDPHHMGKGLPYTDTKSAKHAADIRGVRDSWRVGGVASAAVLRVIASVVNDEKTPFNRVLKYIFEHGKDAVKELRRVVRGSSPTFDALSDLIPRRGALSKKRQNALLAAAVATLGLSAEESEALCSALPDAVTRRNKAGVPLAVQARNNRRRLDKWAKGHWGQLKLFASTLRYLTAELLLRMGTGTPLPLIVFMGASPGENIFLLVNMFRAFWPSLAALSVDMAPAVGIPHRDALYIDGDSARDKSISQLAEEVRLQPGTHRLLVGRAFNVATEQVPVFGKNALLVTREVIDRFFAGTPHRQRDFLLVYDIRQPLLDDSERGAAAINQYRLRQDNAMMCDVVEYLAPVRALLKMRFCWGEHSARYLAGTPRFQIYCSPHSTEVRLEVERASDGSFPRTTYALDELEDRCFAYNTELRAPVEAKRLAGAYDLWALYQILRAYMQAAEDCVQRNLWGAAERYAAVREDRLCAGADAVLYAALCERCEVSAEARAHFTNAAVRALLLSACFAEHDIAGSIAWGRPLPAEMAKLQRMLPLAELLRAMG